MNSHPLPSDSAWTRMALLARRWGTAVAATLVLVWGSGAAMAGDWYLRAGLGIDQLQDAQFRDEDCSAGARQLPSYTGPLALYSCGVGNDSAPLRTIGGFTKAPTFELAVGFETTPSTRLELLTEYRPDVAFEGHANFAQLRPEDSPQTVRADISSLAVMLAGYLDLPTVDMGRLGQLTPFLGAGAGLARTSISESRMTFPKTSTFVPSGRRVNFAWMTTAGVALPVADRTLLEVAWRYTDLGLVETAQGQGRILWNADASPHPSSPLHLGKTRAPLRSHGVRLSIRRYF